ncbi:NAD(P)-dependent dehydrogenase (short-subunit alcohol dehydrogenase family) [Rhizobium sp. OAE497]
MTSSNHQDIGTATSEWTSGKTVLVFGATGQQGGAVASALRADGWSVRALVRNPDAQRSRDLASLGVEVVQGDFTDEASIRSAMAGVYGVFSVQPSSGQGAVYGVSDNDEVRYGKVVADIRCNPASVTSSIPR